MFNFYAPTTCGEKLDVWEEASKVDTNLKFRSIMCMRDFNTPLYPSKNLGVLEDFSKGMYDLEGFLCRNDLLDVEV